MTASTAKSGSERLVGTVIADRFLVKRRLAAGGMGVVYHAEQVPLGRPVALKIMDPHHDEDAHAHFVERFLLEAAAVAKLSHPNTIVLYDYGETDDGLFFYAMEYVDGLNLRTWVKKRGPLAPADAIHMAMQVAGSVREAHREGMIHRDLKPGNLMITERHDDPWFVKVLDFGLVKVLGANDGVDLTQSGMLLGSPRYMAPEQVLGGTLDARVDVYALGAVLYYALTGRHAFADDSKFEVMRAQVDDAPDPLAVAHETCAASPRLEACVMKCLEKHADDRFQSMDALGQELAACARELGVDEPSLSGNARAFDSGVERARNSRPSLTHREPHARRREVEAPPREPDPEPTPPPQAAPAPAPAPAGGSRTPLVLAGAALAGLALSLGIVFAIVSFDREAPSPDPTPTVPAVTPEPAPEASPVRIETAPEGARVRRGEEDLGDAPFSLEIPGGERWELTVSHEGYQPRTLTVTSGRDRLMVHLTPLDEPEGSEDAPAVSPQGHVGRSHPAEPTTSPTAPTPHPLDAPPPPPTITPTPAPTPAPPPTQGRRGSSDLRHPWAQK